MKRFSIVVAGLATLSFAAVAQAEDFPATPMNPGPPSMRTTPMPMAAPMQPMQPAGDTMQKPMMKKMSARQKKMMKRQQMAQ